MITPIDLQLIDDHTELSRSKLMKSTIMLDSGKRHRIQLTIMEAGNNVNQRVHSVMLTDIRSEFAIEKLFNNFNGEN
jgi:hypothetical protein